MIDELNKYAPREGNSPIKDVLLDIAERGRSLGIILIGAQQTASEVERRIVSQLQHQGRRPARRRRSRPPRIRLPAAQPAHPGHRWPSPAPCSSASRRSRCRSPSNSRSRPGPPGPPNAAPHQRFPAGPRRPIRSPGCPSTTTTPRRSDRTNVDGQPAGSDDPVRSSPVFSRRARRRLRPRRQECCGSRTPTEADRPACSPPPRHP